MIHKLNLENLLFLDIETVPETKYYSDLSEDKHKLRDSKSKYQRKEDYSAEDFYDRAGIWAEFGKIICISVGYFTEVNSVRRFRVTSFYGDEHGLLLEFKALIETHFSKPKHLLCAHNGKEFDFPFIARRMVIHKISLPLKLNLFGKKPWEVPHLDTLELWKFGDFKHYTSLKLLTSVLGIPSPKDDIDGSEIFRVYYEEKNVERIVTYCQKDTIAVAQVILRLRGETVLEADEIDYI